MFIVLSLFLWGMALAYWGMNKMAAILQMTFYVHGVDGFFYHFSGSSGE